MKTKLKKPKKYKEGGQISPYITHDSKDPRIQAYKDSLSNYNWGIEALEKLQNRNPDIKPKSNPIELPNKEFLGKGNQTPTDVLNFPNSLDYDPKGKLVRIRENNIGQYKKPVQPVVYQPKEKAQEYGYEDGIKLPVVRTREEGAKTGSRYILQSKEDKSKPKLTWDGRKIDAEMQALDGSTADPAGLGRIYNAYENGWMPQKKKRPAQKPIYQELVKQEVPVQAVPQVTPKPNGDHYMGTQFPNVQMVQTKDGQRFYENSKGERTPYTQNNSSVTNEFQYKKMGGKIQPLSKNAKLKAVYKYSGQIPKYNFGGDILNGLGTVMKTAAPFAAFIPGVGPLAAAGLEFGGQALGQGLQDASGQNRVNPNGLPPIMQQGGPVGGITINAEHNELIIDPKTNKVMKDLKNLPNHPNNENLINPEGNLNLGQEFVGKLVIPKNGVNGRDAFLGAKKNSNTLKLNTIKRNLTNKQAIMEAQDNADSMQVAKHGGKITMTRTAPVKSRWKYDVGGLLGNAVNKQWDQQGISMGDYANYLGHSDNFAYNPLTGGLMDSNKIPSADASTNLSASNWAVDPNSRAMYGGQEPSTNSTTQSPFRPTDNRNYPPTTYDHTQNSPKPGFDLGKFAVNNVGNMYQLGNAVLSREKTPYVSNKMQGAGLNQLVNRSYNIDPQLNANKSTFIGGNYALKQGGMNGSEYRNNLTNQLKGKYMADAQAYATKNNYDNQYKGEYGSALINAGEADRGYQERANTANEQNRARRQDMIGSSLSSVGRNYGMQQNDDLRMSLLPTMFPGMGKIDSNQFSQLKQFFSNQ